MSLHNLHDSYGGCSRCGAEIQPGPRTKTIEVKVEIWQAGDIVLLLSARAVFDLCVPCSRNINFKRIAMGRTLTELDLLIQDEAENAELEGNRPRVVAALGVPPNHLTGANQGLAA